MIKSLFITALFLYLVATALLFSLQRKLLYFPTPSVAHGLKVEWLQQGREKLEVITLNPGNAKAVIYFGGNAEVVSNNAELFNLQLPGQTVYLLNYRGYGASTGSPSEKALFADAIALFDRVATRHDQVSVMGRSLGTGVGIYLASQRKVERLLLITPYDSISAVAQSHYPFFPVRYLLQDKFDSIKRAPSLELEVMVVLAETDQVIPRIRSEALIEVLTKVDVWQVPGSGHNTVSDHNEYGARIKSFFTKALPPKI